MHRTICVGRSLAAAACRCHSICGLKSYIRRPQATALRLAGKIPIFFPSLRVGVDVLPDLGIILFRANNVLVERCLIKMFLRKSRFAAGACGQGFQFSNKSRNLFSLLNRNTILHHHQKMQVIRHDYIFRDFQICISQRERSYFLIDDLAIRKLWIKPHLPMLAAHRDEVRAGCAVVVGFESGAPAVDHCSVKPKFLSCALESRQFSLTLTHVWRNTLVPIKASMSVRASSPIFLSMAPFLPMMMPLWLSFSQ